MDQSESDELLRRILAAVEKDRRRGALELVIAILLSLATLTSTWCGYQARLWGAVGGAKQTAAGAAERKAAENMILGLQLRTQDGLMLIECWRALRQNDAITSETILAHMRPQLQAAVQASIDAGALSNPEVPGPLQRPEYVLPEEQEAKRQREEAMELRAVVQAASRNADAYVVLTLMFASVLFFGGIAGTFTHRRVRIGLAAVAIVLFTATVAIMMSLPPCPA